jgi:RNA polymerase sigma-70 factor, ECF subfamily
VNASSESIVSSANVTQSDFEALFRADYGRIARVIARVVGDRSRSEELAVEVFLKLWRNQEIQAENVQGWLYRVAVRTGLEELRRQMRRRHYERMLAWIRPRPAPATPEQIHSTIEEQGRVRSVLAMLKPRQAQLLLLRNQDLTYDQMGSILDLNPASIGTLLIRAQESFRKEYLKAYGQE